MPVTTFTEYFVCVVLIYSDLTAVITFFMLDLI